MKRRIIAFFLILISAFSLFTPSLACSGSSKTCFYTNYGGALNNDTYLKIFEANYDITGDYDDFYITLVILESWDGDFSSETASAAIKKLYTRNMGMTIIFDIEERNYGIKTGSGIKNLFDDTLVDRYLGSYFREYYEAGEYDKAVQSLFSELSLWYQQNYDEIMAMQSGSGNYYSFYRHPLFIIFTSIIILALLHILYGTFAWLADLKHRFDEFYIERNMPIPPFNVRHIRTAPFFASYERNIWSYISAMWKERHPFRSCFEQPDVEQNIFDNIAMVIKLIVLMFIGIVILLITIFSSGDGDSSHSSSGSGGGGHSGGGGGGRR